MSEADQTIQESPLEVKRRKNREKTRKWRNNNPEKWKSIARRAYHKDVEKQRARDRERWPKRSAACGIVKKLHGEKNKSKVSEKGKIRYRLNRERITKRQRDYHNRNKHKAAAYRHKNHARCLEWQRNWQRSNKEKIRHYCSKRRALEMSCESRATPEQVRQLLRRATHCFYCKSAFGRTLKKTLDHVIPLVKYGPHSIENLVAACKPCNCKKNTKLQSEFAKDQGVLFF